MSDSLSKVAVKMRRILERRKTLSWSRKEDWRAVLFDDDGRATKLDLADEMVSEDGKIRGHYRSI